MGAIVVYGPFAGLSTLPGIVCCPKLDRLTRRLVVAAKFACPSTACAYVINLFSYEPLSLPLHL